ncbi:MAG TPA: OB-fold nucleic acid binding domain-containing protein, partial [Chitinophagaceae bacterium]|nr:OB-fold nucleic acid binding domain-containing protein [Chitinophagaceae bacterium]
EVTGMFISGHPLDHFKFELEYYNVRSLRDYNEIAASDTLKSVNVHKPIRLAGLVTDAQHRVTKTGKNYGRLMIEDYSGNTELVFWSEEYARFRQFFELQYNLLITGSFQPRRRFNDSTDAVEYEFKVTNILMLDTVKRELTKQVVLNIEARFLNQEMVSFIERNVKSHPGKAGLRFNISESKNKLKVGMYTMETGFEMNDEMAAWLRDKPEVEVHVVTN